MARSTRAFPWAMNFQNGRGRCTKEMLLNVRDGSAPVRWRRPAPGNKRQWTGYHGQHTQLVTSHPLSMTKWAMTMVRIQTRRRVNKGRSVMSLVTIQARLLRARSLPCKVHRQIFKDGSRSCKRDYNGTEHPDRTQWRPAPREQSKGQRVHKPRL